MQGPATAKLHRRRGERPFPNQGVWLSGGLRFQSGLMRGPCPVIGHARVFVADRGGEEFEKAAGGMVASGGDRRRHDDGAGNRDRIPGD